MAITYSFGYTNTSIDVSDPQTYALITDEPNKAQYRNVTTPIDQDQIVTFQSDTVGKEMKAGVQVSNPSPANAMPPLFYGIRSDSILRATSSLSDDVQDMPLVLNLTIKHPKNAGFTADAVAHEIEMLLSSIGAANTSSPIGYSIDRTRLTQIMKSSLTA